MGNVVKCCICGHSGVLHTKKVLNSVGFDDLGLNLDKTPNLLINWYFEINNMHTNIKKAYNGVFCLNCRHKYGIHCFGSWLSDLLFENVLNIVTDFKTIKYKGIVKNGVVLNG